MYILEGDPAVVSRIQNLANCNCRPDIMRMIQQIMETVSPYAAAYKRMYQDQIRQFGVHAKTVKMIFKRGYDQRRLVIVNDCNNICSVCTVFHRHIVWFLFFVQLTHQNGKQL